MVLTDDCYIVGNYGSDLEKIMRYKKVPLTNVRQIELGRYQQAKFFQASAPAHLCLRLNYCVDNQDGYFHMFRSANFRFFNNSAYVIRTQEEITESLTAIVDMFRIALDNAGNTAVSFMTSGVLERRKSRLLDVPTGMPRNLSESQLVQFSSKALSNVAGQFSKLGQTFKKPAVPAQSSATVNPQVMRQLDDNIELDIGVEAEKVMFTVGNKKRSTNSTSSTDTDEHDNSLYEPDSDGEIAMGKSNFNENAFLPSVGIVMGSSQKQEKPTSSSSMQQLQQRDSKWNASEDMLSISINTVTDNVGLPNGMLENGPPVRPITPNPQIYIAQAYEVREDELVKPYSRSVFYE